MRRVAKAACAALAGAVLLGAGARGGASAGLEGLDAVYPSLEALYLDLHRNPELSLQEEKTAAKLAARLRELGYEVTEKVGGHGVVGVLRNGAGPTVLLRTDTDALPVKEQTGLDYASKATATTAAGESVAVMHACGHDVHMAAWVGAAALLKQRTAEWRGTVVLVAQPAEEILQGARAMLKDGLFTRFPKPDYVLGVHVAATLPAGQVGIVSGPASAASNAVDITFYGKGGHGSTPHLTVDPVVMAARAVVTLQTIVAREVDPFETAVVTVGTFHAGTKRNIIPDEAKLELTVRTYTPEVKARVLAAIARIAKAEAEAAGATRPPLVTMDEAQSADVVVNDPALAARMKVALARAMGAENVVDAPPVTGSEDFGMYGAACGAPSIQLRLGAVEPGLFAEAKAAKRLMLIPGPHNGGFAPDRERTIRAGVEAFVVGAMEVLGRP